MGRHLNPLEQELLIRQFKGNDRVTLYEFCTANNVSMNSFRHCIRIIVQDKGHIVEESTFEQLKEKGGLFAEMIKRQEL